MDMDPLPTKLLKSLYPIMDPLPTTGPYRPVRGGDLRVFLAGKLNRHAPPMDNSLNCKRSKMTCKTGTLRSKGLV